MSILSSEKQTLNNYRNNEINTNKLVSVVSLSFVLLFIYNEISFYLFSYESLKIANEIIFFPCTIYILITVIISYHFNFDRPWIKYVLLCGMLVTCNACYFLLTLYCTYFLLIPFIVSTRYFNKKITLFVIINSFILFIVASILNIALDGYSSFINKMHDLLLYNSWQNPIDAITFIIFPISIVFIFIGFYVNRATSNGLHLLREQSEEYIKNSSYENELKVAAEIQVSTLPSDTYVTPNGNFEICAGQIAAKEVCGDCYDYFNLNDHTLGFIVADVADKGLSAAMFMMSSRKAMECALRCSDSFDEAIVLANKLICSDNPKGMFVTFWLGVIDTLSGLGQYVNAGHIPPIIKHADGSTELIENEPDLFIGNFPDISPKVYKLLMREGDILLLYTDGISDARNIAGDSFTMQPIIDIVKKCDNNPHELRTAIMDNVSDFSRGTDQFDDMTLLAIKCNATIPPSKLSIINDIGAKGTFDVITTVNELLMSIDCPEEIRRNINVVVDEICNNISEYAYTADGKIYLDITYGNNYCVLQFRDDGVPFDPLSHSEQNDNNEIKIGGRGIFLAKKLSDEMHYSYYSNQNVLTIKFMWNILK